MNGNVLIILEQGSSSKKNKSTMHTNPVDLPVDKSIINKGTSHEMFHDQTNTYPSSISPLNDSTAKSNQTTDEKLNEIFTLTKQKLQPTINALQDKRDELLSASKTSPDSFISNEHPNQSILRNTESKPRSSGSTDLFFAAIKERQRQTQNKPFKTASSSETNPIKPTVSDGIGSDIKSKLEEGSPNEADNTSISTPENYLTSKPDEQTLFNPKVNKTNSTTKKEDFKQLEKQKSRSISDINTQKITSPISENKVQESIPNQFDSSFNEFQQEKLQKEISKAVSQIMKQAAHIVHDDIRSPQFERKSINDRDRSKQEKVFPFTSEQLKYLSTKTSSTLNNQGSDTENQSDKPLLITDKQTSNGRLQQEESTLTNISPSMNLSEQNHLSNSDTSLPMSHKNEHLANLGN